MGSNAERIPEGAAWLRRGQLRVVVITTKDEVYHKHLCAEMAKRHNVVGVLHPLWPTLSRAERLARTRKRIERYGLAQYILRKTMSARLFARGWDEGPDVARAAEKLVPTAVADYAKWVGPSAHDVGDINSKEGIALLSSYEPDVVVCSGGPIYRAPLIGAAPLMLNFHTGLSPVYNGSRTIYWTYANRQPHLTAGTMMVMSPVVDGGAILGHFLPAVEAGDTPGAQFVKTIIGGVSMYSRFLAHLEAGRPFVSLPQGKPFRVYYEEEWTPFQPFAIQRYIDADICGKFVRPERVYDYWSQPDVSEAERLLKEVLLSAVYNP
jgi:folate-dependent phosphoribosylglycinamide formyltransferase PurN